MISLDPFALSNVSSSNRGSEPVAPLRGWHRSEYQL